jgi:hypothetical protein
MTLHHWHLLRDFLCFVAAIVAIAALLAVGEAMNGPLP